ncbi:MAG: radical SAM protein [Candidatus Omnitrophota bacterium]|nr:radical SAM protein [Candidatus Omnitrophota bacterium]
MDTIKESLAPKPVFCILNVYPLCMFKCKMCYIWKRSGFEMMSFEKIKQFIDTLAEFTENKVAINFIGGEPLLRKDIFDLIAAASKYGLRTSLCTNGYLLDYAMAKRLCESGLNGLAISLDSLDEQTHDAMRGKKGSYRKIMQAMEYLSCFISKEFEVNIQTIISQQNLTGLVELAKWVQGSAVFCGIYYMAVVQPLDAQDADNWRIKEPYRALWPQEPKEVNAVIDELIRLRSSEIHSKIGNSVSQFKAFKSYFEEPDRFLKRISCNVGAYALNVDYAGDCSPCFNLGIIGNICKDNIKDMWHSDKALQLRQKMKQCSKNCNFLINCYKAETSDESELMV